MIKICTFSDGHGYLPEITEGFDLILLGGDNVSLDCQSSKILTREWYMNEFVEWINKLPFNDFRSKVVFICGNHEVGFQRQSFTEVNDLIASIKQLTNDRIVYLQNEQYTFWKCDEHITIFGTPYCKIFGRWAYNETQESLNNLYSKMPEDCDILLSHDAPYGVSDLCYGWIDWGRSLEHIGNQALRDVILEKKPKYNIHGHLHTANHEFEQLGNTQVVCVSLLDEAYKVVYKPLYLEL